MKTKICYTVFFARWLCMIIQISVIFIPFIPNLEIIDNSYVFCALMFYPFRVFLIGIMCEFRWLVLTVAFILSITIIVFAVLGIKYKKSKDLSLILIFAFVTFDCVFSLIYSDTDLKIIETIRALFLNSMCLLCLYDLKRKQCL